MFKYVVTLCLLVASAPLAHAADPAIRGGYFPEQPPVAVAPARHGFDWSRCYLGAHFGQSISKVSTHLDNTPFYDAKFIADATTNLVGPVVGGQVGCNADIGGGLLAGIELDGSLTSIDQKNCQTQTDPVSYCLKFKRSSEASITGRFGMTFGNGNCADCGPSTFVYARLGFGFNKLDIDANVNANSYVSQVITSSVFTFPAGTYRPIWAMNYDLAAQTSAIAPIFGIGVEHALDQNWTVRADLTTKISLEKSGNLSVTKINQVTGTPGAPLPQDLSAVTRGVASNDVIPYKIKELGTKFTMGVNRYF
ncbi:MAG: porin family protein [Hyphomicrobiales bacterium]|nr:porin family protein [Hyphomicrobiales bacterium]